MNSGLFLIYIYFAIYRDTPGFACGAPQSLSFAPSLKDIMMRKIVVWLLVLIFGVSNITYGYDSDTLRHIRNAEVLRNEIEALIGGYYHHEVVIDLPLFYAGKREGTPDLKPITYSELTEKPYLKRLLDLFEEAGLGNLKKALEELSKAEGQKLQRFKPRPDQWVIEGRQIDGHASDKHITIRDGLRVLFFV